MEPLKKPVTSINEPAPGTDPTPEQIAWMAGGFLPNPKGYTVADALKATLKRQGMPGAKVTDALTQVRRNASQTVSSSFQTQRVDQFGGQVYNRSNATIASMSTPVGSNAIASGNRSTAYGAFAYAKEDSATALGVYAQASGPSSVAIGDQAKAFGYRAIVIGRISSASGINSIVIGVGAKGSAQNSIAIGNLAVSSGLSSIAIGYSTTASAAQATAVGSSSSATGVTSTALGFAANSGFLDSIAIGANSTTTASAQFVSGSSTDPITDIYFGDGVTKAGTPTTYTIHGTGGSGSDIAGGIIVIAGGRGTGTGIGGKVTIQTAPAGSSSSSANALVTGATVDQNGMLGLLCEKRVSSNFDKTNATLTAITGLSVTLTGAIAYSFIIVLHMQETTTGGIQFDFNGGTATMTSFIADVVVNGVAGTATVQGVYRASALTSAYNLDDGSGNYRAIIQGTMLVNAAGTFQPRFAQNDAAGTSRVLAGSWMKVTEVL